MPQAIPLARDPHPGVGVVLARSRPVASHPRELDGRHARQRVVCPIQVALESRCEARAALCHDFARGQHQVPAHDAQEAGHVPVDDLPLHPRPHYVPAQAGRDAALSRSA